MHVIPALLHLGRWYIIPNKINGRRKSLSVGGMVSLIQTPAGRDYLESETASPFIPDAPLPPGDTSNPVSAK
jgi:hypothetical protein